MDWIYYILPFIIIIIISLLIAYILSEVRIFKNNFNQNTENIIEGSVGWAIVVYGLILGFSISNFYNRYITIRDTFVEEVTNLQLIYRYIKIAPNSKEKNEAIESIRKYAESVINDLLPNLADRKYSLVSDIRYKEMNSKIINFVNKHTDYKFNHNILLRMSTDERIKQLVNEMNFGLYYIYILIFLIIFIIIPLWLNVMANKIVQLIIDSCILIILFTGIYLCILLNNPFTKSPVSFDFSLYKDLINDIKVSA